MLYKFKSQADADVLMLEANGDQMLTLIGRQPSARGIITVAQIPAAIAALEAAVLAHEAVHEVAQAPGHEPPETALKGDGVRLRARAAPLITLLQNSALAGDDVVWGV